MQKPVVYCVDDEAIILQGLKMELQDAFGGEVQIEIATRAETALEHIDKILENGGQVSVVISDQRMIGMQGDQFLMHVKEISPSTLSILLTGHADIDAIVRSINYASLYRYISKPWESHDLILTVKEALRRQEQELLIEEKNQKIEKLTIAMVSALENANLFNDHDTGSHVKRVSEFSESLANLAGFDNLFVRRIHLYSSLHDIGKVGIPQEILNKPGRYTPDEFEAMKLHVVIGAKMLDNPDIDRMAYNIACYHHERWDGKGYMNGLNGVDIPVEARIVAIVDAFDAMTTRRVYKEAMSCEKALELLKSESGSHFDPALCELFIANHQEIIATAGATTLKN